MFSNDKRPCGAVFLSSTLAFLSETEGIARYPVTRDRSGFLCVENRYEFVAMRAPSPVRGQAYWQPTGRDLSALSLLAIHTPTWFGVRQSTGRDSSPSEANRQAGITAYHRRHKNPSECRAQAYGGSPNWHTKKRGLKPSFFAFAALICSVCRRDYRNL